MVKINGESVSAEGMTIGEYLTRNGYQKNRVVVEKNLEILAREDLDTILIQENDSIEILSFVGGG